MGFVVLANPSPPGITDDDVPPVHNCCDDIVAGIVIDPDNPADDAIRLEYEKCLGNPAAYCTIPIDNSRYVYISIVAGVALASFVIARAVERKNKKTPI